MLKWLIYIEILLFLPLNSRATDNLFYKGIKIHATWYGKPFHGRRTASGEQYDMTKLTAAHHSFPFGTRLLVWNPKNNKSVIVRINDRCPKKRILDLSKAAADSIGIRSGKVEIWVLNKRSKLLAKFGKKCRRFT